MDPLLFYSSLALGSSSILALLLILFYKIIKVFPKKVTCWFCGSKSHVNYDDANSWNCSHCEQYNGFDKDGGYNKDIPAQYNELLNNKSCVSRSGKWTGNGAQLCDTCNYNQHLKVTQLASFQPINEARYDFEIKHFKQQLEDSYRLCKPCEGLLKNVLKKIAESAQASAPRRLCQKAGKIVKRWKLVWLVPLVAACLEAALTVELSRYITWASQASAAIIGVVLIAQCWFYKTTWAWIHTALWAVTTTLPYWRIAALKPHITVCQTVLSLGIFISSLIIAIRRLRYENRLIKRQAQRELKRSRDGVRVWSVPSFHENLPAQSKKKNEEKTPTFNQEAMKENAHLRSSLLKPSSFQSDVLRPSVVRPQVRRSLDHDMSLLKLNQVENNCNKSVRSSNPFSPSLWDEKLSRSSSQSSGISSLGPQRTSPEAWAKENSHFSPLPSMISTPITCSTLQSPPRELSWNSCRSHLYSPRPSQNSPIQPFLGGYPPKYSSEEYPYSAYPVTYYYSQIPKSGSELSSFFQLMMTIPALVLAASNAALVYILYQKTN